VSAPPPPRPGDDVSTRPSTPRNGGNPPAVAPASCAGGGAPPPRPPAPRGAHARADPNATRFLQSDPTRLGIRRAARAAPPPPSRPRPRHGAGTAVAAASGGDGPLATTRRGERRPKVGCVAAASGTDRRGDWAAPPTGAAAAVWRRAAAPDAAARQCRPWQRRAAVGAPWRPRCGGLGGGSNQNSSAHARLDPGHALIARDSRGARAVRKGPGRGNLRATGRRIADRAVEGSREVTQLPFMP